MAPLRGSKISHFKDPSRKIDLRKQLKPLYAARPSSVQVLDVPSMNFIMTDGSGDPNSAPFQSGIQTLYNLAYTIKFDYKIGRRVEFPVMALEGLWWVEGASETFDMSARDRWKWTLMIVQPDIVTGKDVASAAEKVRGKGRQLAPFRLERFQEGLSAQTMHLGPYSTEAPTIKLMRIFIEHNGYVPRGRHHEIYLGDPRRTSPARLKTILRQPVKQASSNR